MYHAFTHCREMCTHTHQRHTQRRVHGGRGCRKMRLNMPVNKRGYTYTKHARLRRLSSSTALRSACAACSARMYTDLRGFCEGGVGKRGRLGQPAHTYLSHAEASWPHSDVYACASRQSSSVPSTCASARRGTHAVSLGMLGAARRLPAAGTVCASGPVAMRHPSWRTHRTRRHHTMCRSCAWCLYHSRCNVCVSVAISRSSAISARWCLRKRPGSAAEAFPPVPARALAFGAGPGAGAAGRIVRGRGAPGGACG